VGVEEIQQLPKSRSDGFVPGVGDGLPVALAGDRLQHLPHSLAQGEGSGVQLGDYFCGYVWSHLLNHSRKGFYGSDGSVEVAEDYSWR